MDEHELQDDVGALQARRIRSGERRSDIPRNQPSPATGVLVAALLALVAAPATNLGPRSGPPPTLCAVSGIGVLREGPLHAAIKAVLVRPGDRFEVPVGRFVIDVVRADGELVEIQTGGFAALGRKLDALLDAHRMRIIYPIAAQRRIVRVDERGEVVATRRSPRRAEATEIFERVVAFPSLLTHPNLTIELLLLAEDHVRAPAPGRYGRRQRLRDPGQRRLVDVLQRIVIADPGDLVALLPELPAAPFSTRRLAELIGCPLPLAQRVVYCLRATGALQAAGRSGRAPLHRLTCG